MPWCRRRRRCCCRRSCGRRRAPHWPRGHPTPFRNVRRDASLPNTASNCPIPMPPRSWPDPRMMVRARPMRKPGSRRLHPYTCQTSLSVLTTKDVTDDVCCVRLDPLSGCRRTGGCSIRTQMTSYWHPFADGAAVEAAGELSIVRAEGSHIWDADGAALPGCHREPLVLQRRARTPGDRRRRGRADARARELLDLPGPDEPRRVGAGRSGRRDRPDGRCEGVPDERRVRFDRHGDQDGAAVLAARRAAGAHDPASARARVSRDARRGHVAGRDRAEPGGLRAAAARCRGGGVGRRRRAARDDRTARRRPGRGVLLRAGDRRGRGVRAAARVPRAGARGLPRDRRAVRRRRGDHRVRTDAASGSRAPGWGSSPTSSRARRASRAGTCRSARCSWRRPSGDRSSPRAPGCSATATPTRATRRSRRRRWPTSTSWSATTSWRGPSSWRRTSPRALRPLADHELVSEVRAGTGVLAAVQLDPERLRADAGLVGRVVPACREERHHDADAGDRGDPDLAAARACRRRGATSWPPASGAALDEIG